jgi:hypothetical protein
MKRARTGRLRRVIGVVLCAIGILLASLMIRGLRKVDWITISLGRLTSVEVFVTRGHIAMQWVKGPHAPTSWLDHFGWAGHQVAQPAVPVRFYGEDDHGVIRHGCVLNALFFMLFCGTVGGYLIAAPTLRRWGLALEAGRSSTICSGCGYDLRGTPDRPCPECGQIPSRPG